MVGLADACEGSLGDVAWRSVGILRLFRPGALFIYSMIGWVRIEMRLS
jgi:hypothetical protein